MRDMRLGLLVLAALSVAACNTVPSYEAQPLVTANGSIGFSVQGVASYTKDRAAAETQIRKVLEKACQGPIRLLSLRFEDASSRAGVPHLAYSATAACI